MGVTYEANADDRAGNSSISILALKLRPNRILQENGITSIDALCRLTRDYLLVLPQMGAVSVDEIEAALHERGWSLAESIDASSPDDLVDASAAYALGAARRRSGAKLEKLLAELAESAYGDLELTDMSDLMRVIVEQPSTLPSEPLAELLKVPLAPLAGIDPTQSWSDVLLGEFVQLGDRDQIIVQNRAPGPDQLTLEELGKLIDVTRERIRQIADNRVAHLGKHPAIRRARLQLSKLLTSIHSLPALRALGFDLPTLETSLLALCAREHFKLSSSTSLNIVDWAGTLWLCPLPGLHPKSIATQILATFPDEVCDIAPLKSALAEGFLSLVQDEAEAEKVAARAIDELPIRAIRDDRFIRWNGSYADKAVRYLRLRGQHDLPTLAEIATFVEPTQPRGVTAQVQTDSRFVRSVNGRYGLDGWDIARYKPLLDMMRDLVSEHGGQMSLRQLVREASPFFKPTSVTMYAQMHDAFVMEGEAVRLRRPDEPIAMKPIELTGAAYRKTHGPNRGCWSVVREISDDLLHKTSVALPPPFAGVLGIEHSGEKVDLDCDGISVTGAWSGMDCRLHSSGGFREALKAAGMGSVSWVRIIATSKRCFSLEILPPMTDSCSPLERIAKVIGASSVDNALSELGYAIGLEEPLDGSAILQRLLRRNDALYSSFLAAFPEFEP